MEYDSLSIIDILYIPFSSLPFTVLDICSDIYKYKCCFLYGQSTNRVFAEWQRKHGGSSGPMHEKNLVFRLLASLNQNNLYKQK